MCRYTHKSITAKVVKKWLLVENNGHRKRDVESKKRGIVRRKIPTAIRWHVGNIIRRERAE